VSSFESSVETSRPVVGNGAQYTPIAQIGRGGMAEVLLAMVESGSGVERLAVLKRIWPELAAEPDFMEMFLDEARLSLRLNHANVVQTYEVLTGNGQVAIAMEYLHGQPLTRIMNRMLRGSGQLSLPLRLRILTSVLAGLEHAHTLTDLDGTPMEVVHRDVSPQNVFVTYDGQVKLVDFGVAKTLAASHHTRPGAIKGKLAYMAPEQLQRNTIDRRADVFAVGVMLWEMLAGRRMWHGMTEVEIVAHLASGQPLPPLPSDGSVPAGVEAICARALDLDPDRRYQTAADLELALEGVLAGAADSHTRNLGKVVSLAFDVERADRQAFIERCVRQRAAAARAALTTTLESELPNVDVTLSGLDAKPALRPKWAWPWPHAVWLRRAAAVAALVGVAAAIALVDGGGKPSATDARAQAGQHAGAAAAAGFPSVAGTGARPGRGSHMPMPELTARRQAPVADGAFRDDPPRPRRRRQAPVLDEDATLPPSATSDDQRDQRQIAGADPDPRH